MNLGEPPNHPILKKKRGGAAFYTALAQFCCRGRRVGDTVIRIEQIEENSLALNNLLKSVKRYNFKMCFRHSLCQTGLLLNFLI